ncbi:hypothetical protein DKK71_02655 [Snodgrassella alvi]|uniref:hypothetical protein n=1 Tax=Snodgrassella alvi TaxID=1196083 RepID=UPI000D782B17|nr:hypothetical protein [Snodgrassella alvi]PXY98452.1 hypothetical protein DKK71_02655 [Snodgrassella alvi]
MRYYFNNIDECIYAFESAELAEKWVKEQTESNPALNIRLRELTEDEKDRHLHPEKYLPDEEKLALKRSGAFNLSRCQFLTMTELDLSKDKDALIAIVEENYQGKTLVKLRNYIRESQVFSLDNDELWQFLTVTLNVEPDKLFSMWEEAKSNY